MRNKNGGFRFVKAMGVPLEERNIAQVTMNLTDYTQTSIYTVFETVRMEARRYGVRVIGSEVVGIVPTQALVDCAEYYLQIEDFSSEQLLEMHFWKRVPESSAFRHSFFGGVPRKRLPPASPRRKFSAAAPPFQVPNGFIGLRNAACAEYTR